MTDLYGPPGTTLYLVQLMEQAKQARSPLTTFSFIASAVMFFIPLNISVCQFRVGKMPPSFMAATFLGVPYWERPCTAGVVATSSLSLSAVL